MKVSILGKELHLYELVGRYELDLLDLAEAEVDEVDTESFIFTIDVYREMSGLRLYFPKVYRGELYRLEASFPSNANDSGIVECDAGLLVEDLSKTWSDYRMNSVEEVLEFVLSDIKSRFSFACPTTTATS